MASGMSNFNIKKSFVWKYGLSKLHKKKVMLPLNSGNGDINGGFTFTVIETRSYNAHRCVSGSISRAQQRVSSPT